MKRFIIENLVNSRKLAVIEDEKLNKLIIEENFSNNILNNIYRGRIINIKEAMGAMFIDIGEKAPVYLEIGNKVKKIYTEGEQILVQIVKESKGEKRAVASEEISLAGKYLVYIPSSDKISFSGKIKDKAEITRLKEIMFSEAGNKRGYIIRTEAVGVSADKIRYDILELDRKYNEILNKYNSSINPVCIYKKSNIILDFIKDNIDDKLDNIVISVEDGYQEDEDMYSHIKNELKSRGIDFLKVLKKEKGIDVFESYGVSTKLKKYISRVVWFGKGIYIVIDKTEALTVIDVNSGRFVGTGKLDDMILSANLAAAEEIAKQIIMRDISGIIIIDFISMKSSYQRKIVMEKLTEKLGLDNRKYKVHGFTSLGLLEISRMRKGNSLEEYYLDDGIPDSKSIDAIIDEIEKYVIHSKYHLEKDRSSVQKELEDITRKFLDDYLIKSRSRDKYNVSNMDKKYLLHIEKLISIIIDKYFCTES